MPVELKGQIETITYANEESGFTIARVKVGGQKDQITIVGNLMALAPGEVLKLQGEWTTHPKFGRQFKVEQYQIEVPATVEGIRKYLGSGYIKGLGPVMAQRIVQQFGKKTLEIIENQTEKLAEVEGVGHKRLAMIKQAWQEQKEIRHVMLFLQSHGVGSGWAVKIFRQYGNNSIAIVKENPYRLASDIFGIGFIIADRIAGQLGFARNSDVRAAAGVLYVLNKLAEEGHVYYPYEPLIEKSGEILQVEREIITKALSSITVEGKIIMEDLNEDLEEFKKNHKAVYLKKLHTSETGIAVRFQKLISASRTVCRVDTDQAIAWVQQQLDITLDVQQAEAVGSSLENKVMVITGGPGTGKTTIINAVLKIFSRKEVRIMLAAPTGRAAKRLSEAVGRER
jgi:exodeoxyribonuclease V alpha subunit